MIENEMDHFGKPPMLALIGALGMVIAIATGVVCLPPGGMAASQPADFAYGMALRVDAPVGRLLLPESIYRAATRPDLGDVAVFNAEGEPVPHILRRQDAQTARQERRAAVPFFPVIRSPAQEESRFSLEIRTDPTGALFQAESRIRAPMDRPVTSYLMDMTRFRQAPTRLTVAWDPPGRNLLARVSLSGSQDLDRWETVVSGTTLVRLTYQGHPLEQNGIAIVAPYCRYYRMSWPRAVPGLQVAGVTAHWEERRDARHAVTRTVDLPPLDEEGAAAVDIGGSFPVTALGVILPEVNSFSAVAFASRPNADAPWRHRTRGLFYNLQVEGAALTSEAAVISPAADPLWRLVFESPGGISAGARPRLSFTYQPHELLFLARGGGPFMLAYGNAARAVDTKPAEALRALVADDHGQTVIGEAAAGERIALGGPDRLKPGPPPIPWRQYLLWLVLVAGVVVLAAMVVRLHRQMKAAGGGAGRR